MPPAPDSLTDCRRLFLRNHVLPVRIGVHDFEKHTAQRVVFEVDLYVPLSASTPRRDDIAEVVDYDFIVAAIAERVGRGHVELQETLCDDLLAALLSHPGVRAARVSTSKPDVYPGGAAIGCEVFARKGTP